MKAAGTTSVGFAVNDREIFVVESIQPLPGTIGGAVVDHNDFVEVIVESLFKGKLQLLQAIKGDDDRDEIAVHELHYTGVTKNAGTGWPDFFNERNWSAALRASATVTSISR
jgi:hypothetical protein